MVEKRHQLYITIPTIPTVNHHQDEANAALVQHIFQVEKNLRVQWHAGGHTQTISYFFLGTS